MRRLALCLMLLAPLGAALAAESPEPVPYPKARSLRNVGIVVTAPGLVMGTASVGLAGLALHHGRTCEYECTGIVYATVFSMASGVVAAPFLGVGLPMWVTGNRRLKTNRATLDASLTVVPMRDGAAGHLAVRF